MYKILESRIEFDENNNLKTVTVLIDCTSNSSPPLSDVRAIRASKISYSGYLSLNKSSVLSPELLQSLAAYGHQIKDRDKVFSGWRSNLKK